MSAADFQQRIGLVLLLLVPVVLYYHRREDENEDEAKRRMPLWLWTKVQGMLHDERPTRTVSGTVNTAATSRRTTYRKVGH